MAQETELQPEEPQYEYYMPMSWNTLWRLHKGLNVNVGASVFVRSGNGWGSGTGFTQDVSLMHVSQLSPKLTLAVGGAVNSMQFKGDQYYAGRLQAMLDYRFNEHWSAYVFVQKAIVSDNVQPCLYSPYRYAGMNSIYAPSYAPGFGYGPLYDERYMDRVAAGVRYEWAGGKNSIELHVELDRVPNSGNKGYDFHRYDYPVR